MGGIHPIDVVAFPQNTENGPIRKLQFRLWEEIGRSAKARRVNMANLPIGFLDILSSEDVDLKL